MPNDCLKHILDMQMVRSYAPTVSKKLHRRILLVVSIDHPIATPSFKGLYEKSNVGNCLNWVHIEIL